MATYGYCRVSTTRQANEGESLDVQRRQIEGYALMHGLVVDEVVVEEGEANKHVVASLLSIAHASVSRAITALFHRPLPAWRASLISAHSPARERR